MFNRFLGPIYQMPPVRSAVKRELRARTIHELELLERDRRLVLFRTRCESGTYIRTLANDLGEALGVGAHLTDLRRTRSGPFAEAMAHPLTNLQDAVVDWKERGDDAALRKLMLPMEQLLSHLPKIVLRDTAVDALCHGANLMVPGIASMDRTVKKGDLVALAAQQGVAAETERVLMEPGTYPKGWKS